MYQVPSPCDTKHTVTGLGSKLVPPNFWHIWQETFDNKLVVVKSGSIFQLSMILNEMHSHSKTDSKAQIQAGSAGSLLFSSFFCVS